MNNDFLPYVLYISNNLYFNNRIDLNCNGKLISLGINIAHTAHDVDCSIRTCECKSQWN